MKEQEEPKTIEQQDLLQESLLVRLEFVLSDGTLIMVSKGSFNRKTFRKGKG